MFCSVINAIELTSGAKQMNTVTRIASVIILTGGALLAGCASEEELAMVKTIAVTADQKADLAGQKAAQAGQRADLANQKADMAAARADQAGQLAANANQEAQQAQALATTANATANYAKGATDSLQAALTAHAVATANARPSSPPRRVARGERG
jgi:hypothetical protein